MSVEKLINKDLRRKIVDLVYTGKDGHIPSAFSIVDILNYLYSEVLDIAPNRINDPNRDYFILSKGHGCVGLYATLHKHGYISDEHLRTFCRAGGILGEHPDCTKIPGVEASTGSLGHGFPFAVGIALGLKIKKMNNRVFSLLGDGECHEGTIWEAANVAANRGLDNLCAIVDWNQSGAQLMPVDDLPARWRAFGWEVVEIDGHSNKELQRGFDTASSFKDGTPCVIVAHTTKGYGVPFIEGHGPWHHRIPTNEEYAKIMERLS